MIIDINLEQKFRLINMYRTFSPPNNHSQMDHFKSQLDIIKHACNEGESRGVIVTKDFNIRFSLVGNTNVYVPFSTTV